MIISHDNYCISNVILSPDDCASNETINPYNPIASQYTRIKTSPTNFFLLSPTIGIIFLDTIPVAIPDARHERPTARPAPKVANPCAEVKVESTKPNIRKIIQ